MSSSSQTSLQSNTFQLDKKYMDINNQYESFVKSSQKQINQTKANESFLSGMWKTNNFFVIESELLYEQKILQLNHITSFQQKCVEDHGNKLKQQLISYLKFINNSINQIFINDKEVKQEIYDFDDLTISIQKFYQINNTQSNFFRQFLLKHVEAQLLMKKFLNKFPNFLLPSIISICEQIFKEYTKSNLSQKDEYELEQYICISYQDLTDKIKRKQNILSELLPTNQNQEQEFGQLIKNWIQGICLVLNGIFENDSSQKRSSIDNFDDFGIFDSTKKIIKSK